VEEGRAPLGDAPVELGGQGKARRGSESDTSRPSGDEPDEGRRSRGSDSLENWPAESGASDGGDHVTSQPWLTPIGEDPLLPHEGEEWGS
jgi:hypothetical protein